MKDANTQKGWVFLIISPFFVFIAAATHAYIIESLILSVVFLVWSDISLIASDVSQIKEKLGVKS